MIYNLQALRAFAASGVVIYHSHATFFGKSTEFHGVALFFALSGYLMCQICNRTATAFASDRFWRIVPNYWAATALMLALFSMWDYWPIDHTLLSMLFIPHDSPAGLHPVLGVGWTLNMEVYFYLVFSLSIAISRPFAPLISAAIIIAVFSLLPHITENKAAIFYFTHQYIWFFIIGIAIHYLTEWIKKMKFDYVPPRWLLPALLILYVTSVLFYDTGIIAVSVLFFAVVVASNQGADIKSRALLLLGNASYACYLLHTILIEYLRHKGVATTGSIPFVIGVLIGSWALALGWHFTVERWILLFRQRISGGVGLHLLNRR